MENYVKSSTIKEDLGLDSSVVKCSSHGPLHGYVHFSKKQLHQNGKVILSGIGGAVNKAISTAELLKKDKPLHQTNRIFYTSIKEIWKPKDNEDLQDIEVVRKIPAISITLQVEEPQIMALGYQSSTVTNSPKPIPRQGKFKKHVPKPKSKDDYPFLRNQKKREEKDTKESKENKENQDSMEHT